jgi:hypothetical protein
MIANTSIIFICQPGLLTSDNTRWMFATHEWAWEHQVEVVPGFCATAELVCKQFGNGRNEKSVAVFKKYLITIILKL